MNLFFATYWLWIWCYLNKWNCALQYGVAVLVLLWRTNLAPDCLIPETSFVGKFLLLPKEDPSFSSKGWISNVGLTEVEPRVGGKYLFSGEKYPWTNSSSLVINTARKKMTLRLPVIILAISLLSIAQFKNHSHVKKNNQEEKMKMLDFWLLFQNFLPNGTIFLLSLQFESLHQQKGNCVSCSSLLLCTEISVSCSTDDMSMAKTDF